MTAISPVWITEGATIDLATKRETKWNILRDLPILLSHRLLGSTLKGGTGQAGFLPEITTIFKIKRKGTLTFNNPKNHHSNNKSYKQIKIYKEKFSKMINTMIDKDTNRMEHKNTKTTKDMKTKDIEDKNQINLKTSMTVIDTISKCHQPKTSSDLS